MASEDALLKEESMEAVSLISDGLAAVMEGCRLPVKMKNPATGAEEWPKAEVIAIRSSEAATSLYYVHYVDYNKRLDEWVSEDRLVATLPNCLPLESGRLRAKALIAYEGSLTHLVWLVNQVSVADEIPGAVGDKYVTSPSCKRR